MLSLSATVLFSNSFGFVLALIDKTPEPWTTRELAAKANIMWTKP